MKNVKGYLQVTELQFTNSSGKDTTALVLCDTDGSNSRVSNDLANRLSLHGSALKLTVRDKNSEEVADAELVEVTLTPSVKQAFEPFKVYPYVRKQLNVGADVINIEALQQTYPHLAVLDPVAYHYENVDDTWTGCVSCHLPVRALRCRREVLILLCSFAHRLSSKWLSNVVFRFSLELF